MGIGDQISDELANFNAQELLDKLLATGRDYVAQGQALAEEKLNIPESGAEREVMLAGLKKGAVASAVLLGLLGTKGGRKLTGTAIKLGGLAALGTAAYKGYQKWQGDSPDAQAIHEAASETAEQRGLLIIQTMVAAANADGKVDDDEQRSIKHQLLEMHLPGELAMQLENIIDSPLSAQELAQLVADKATAAEVYIAARLLVDNDSSPSEKLFLEDLVSALGIDDEFKASLDSQVA